MARVKNPPAVANVPLPKPRPSGLPGAAGTSAPPKWGANGPSGGTPPPPQSDGTFQPIDAATAGAAMLESVKALAPMGITGVDPLQALDGVKDGRATITLPLAPGKFTVGGHNIEVKPGTVVHVQVDVKDGRIVPARDQNGKPTGRGTQLEIDPPVGLALWAKGKGAYVEDAGGGQAAFKADVAGWFDSKLVDFKSTKLTDVVRGLTNAPAPDAAGPANGKAKKDTGSAVPPGLLRMDQVKFDAQVSMTDNVVKAGAAKIDLAPGSTMRISGDGKHATLDGQVNFDSGSLNQAGTQVKLGAGGGHIHADYTTSASGVMHVSTQLKIDNARVDQLSLEHPRKAGDTNPDRLDIGNTTLKNAKINLDAVVTARPGSMMPQLTSSNSRIHGEAEGSLIGAKLTMPGALNNAELKLGPGKFKGTLDLSPGANRLDLDVTNTALDVKDLQTKNQNARLGMRSGHVEGDLHLSSDEGAKTFAFGIAAKKIDVHLDGYKGNSALDNVDFQSIDVGGTGTLKMDSTHGMTLDGAMDVKASVNDLKLSNKERTDAVDFTKGTTFDGKATHLQAGGENVFELDASFNVDAKVKDFAMASNGVTAKGDGALKGKADLVIRGGSASLVMRDAQADIRLDSGAMGSAAGPLGIDLAKGSSAHLNVDELRMGSAAPSSITLGKGSVIDATLDDGHLMVQGKRIDLEKGAHARFEVNSLSEKAGELPALQGSLSLESNLRTESLSGTDLGGIKLTKAGSAAGRVTLQVPDVSLTSDGRVSYRDAQVKLDAKIGNLKPGEAAPDAPLATSGISPKGVLTAKQVKAETAAQIAGISGTDRPPAYDPLDAIKHVQNGVVTLEIPIEGRIGPTPTPQDPAKPGAGLWNRLIDDSKRLGRSVENSAAGYVGSFDFPKGATVKLKLTIENGRIVPGKTEASFPTPGDGIGPVTAKGVHFDKDNSLHLSLDNAFGFDPELPGMHNLPLDLGALVNRFDPKKNPKATPGGLAALKLDKTIIHAQGVTIAPGPMQVPGGWIDVGPDTRLSVNGSLDAATITGTANLHGVDISEGDVVLKGGQGKADLNIAWQKGVATTVLDHLTVDTEYAVNKRTGGDYVKLARGHLTDARLTMTMPTNLDVPKAKGPTQVTLDTPKFTGLFEGARLTRIDPKTKHATIIELGRANVDGEVHLDDKSIQISGHVTNADLAVRGLTAAAAKGAANIDYARLVGSGSVDFSTAGGLSIDADVSSVDVQSSQAKVDAGPAPLGGSAHITGKGHVVWSSDQGLTLEGDLHVDANVSGSATLGAAPPAKAAGRDVKRVTVGR